MRKHRVLALVTDAFGGYGGIAQYNRDFLSGLASSACIESIEVCPRNVHGELEELPPNVVQHAPVQNRCLYSLNAMTISRRVKPTIVFSGHLFHGPLAAFAASLANAKLVSQLHGTEIWNRVPQWRLRPLAISDLVFCVSRDTRVRLLAQVDLVPERAVVLNNTVRDIFVHGDRVSARAKFKLLEGHFAILTVSRLDAREGYKGHDRIIQQIAPLIAAGHDVVYLVAGVGPDRARLEDLARKHGVGERVRFLGKVLSEDLADLYRAADLFALPSEGEGFGIVFLEALACGTPSVGLSVGGATDALGDGSLGYCVKPAAFSSEFKEIVRHLKRPTLAESAALQQRFGQATFRSRLHQIITAL